MHKADTDYLRYMDACQRGWIVPSLPADFRCLPNRDMAYAFRVAEHAIERNVAALMRQIDELQSSRSALQGVCEISRGCDSGQTLDAL